MRRRLISAVLLLSAVLLWPQAAHALDWDEYGGLFGADQVENELPEGAGELMEGVGLSVSEDYGAAIGRVFERGLSAGSGILRTALKSAVLIVLIAALCSVAAVLYTPAEGALDYVQLAGVAAVAAVSVGDLQLCLGLGRSVVQELGGFSHVLLPALTATAAAGGAVGSAAAKYAAAALFMDVLITTVENVLLPVVYAYVAAVVCEGAVGGEGLSGAAAFLKWLAVTLLTVLVLAFVVFLNLSGLVTGAADAAAVRTAKTAISTALPVVGSILSDAAGTVLAGAALLKNTVGAFGLVAVSALCLLPVLQLSCHYLAYKLAARLSSALTGGRLGKTAEGLAGAFGLILGAAGAAALMLFFAVFSFVQTVT